MRAVFRFSKSGQARWISHLDLMRAMTRVVRRAALPARYSQGFHPHIVMSFAQALGVGCYSVGEYMEMELDDAMLPEAAMNLMNTALPDGIELTGAWRYADGAPTLMAAVSASRWLVEFAEPAAGATLEKFRSMLERETIEVVKEGRNGPAKVDIRKGILEVGAGAGAGAGGISIELLLAAGSRLNIRPELVVQAALGGTDAACAITRLELYTTVNERLVPLHNIYIDGETDSGKDHPG